jgi:hypothetical protein
MLAMPLLYQTPYQASFTMAQVRCSCVRICYSLFSSSISLAIRRRPVHIMGRQYRACPSQCSIAGCSSSRAVTLASGRCSAPGCHRDPGCCALMQAYDRSGEQQGLHSVCESLPHRHAAADPCARFYAALLGSGAPREFASSRLQATLYAVLRK